MSCPHTFTSDEGTSHHGLAEALAPQSFGRQVPDASPPATMTLQRRTVSELNSDFAWAHRQIDKRENLSYGSAFMEFVKVIFLKMLSDRGVHNSPHASIGADGSITVPASEVSFSRRWIESLEKDHPSPMDAVQFSQLLSGLETEIHQGTKKRIFSTGEQIRLSNETIKAITTRFESTDLYGIDADLNGRMFETFLNATLRGKDLGQYFTPRSVAKLATRLAQPRAGPDHTDVVLDACCGTGGFLIEALAEMWHTIDENGSLGATEREAQKRVVAESCLYGVDVARDPALARIARINMCLRDGGSRIYQLDALDKSTRVIDNDDVELRGEKAEFRKLLANHPDGFADLVLTNPPFAKEYSRSQESEAKLLDDYALAFDTSGGKNKAIKTLRSSVMFLERYHDLLVPGGRMVSVVDDGILGSDSYARTRSWLRERFLIRAVISLPGDAFQRSQARVKTSLLLLEKRDPNLTQDQPPVFMYYCTAVGVDDSPRQRVLPSDERRRRAADNEIDKVVALYRDFRAGKKVRKWTVPGTAVSERMDVKAVLPSPGTRSRQWKAAGLDVVKGADLLEPAYDDEERSADIIDTTESSDTFTHLRVRYDGFAERGEEIEAADTKYRHLYVVHAGDLVIGHINAVHGATAVVPDGLDGCIVTNEYTVCRTLDDIDVRVLWALLRSPVARADLLLLSTGIGRTRVDWDQIARLRLPYPTDEEQQAIVHAVTEAEAAERSAQELRASAQHRVHDELLMDSKDAHTLLAAFRPPR